MITQAHLTGVLDYAPTHGVFRWRGHWSSAIRVNRKLIHLGTFDTPEAAHAAYVAAAKEHFGEFANPGHAAPSIQKIEPA